jgi:superfamily II DNA/RNA helicase
VGLIINYDLPYNREHYIRRLRVCRMGGNGLFGLVVNFAMEEEIGMLHEIEQYYETQVGRLDKSKKGKKFTNIFS